MAEHTFVRVAQRRGAAVVVGERQVIPVALTVHAQAMWRGKVGLGFAWGRPLAVEVTEGGQTRRLAIPDVQLRLGLALGVVGIVLSRMLSLVKR